ncbi:NADH/ubiquinone/plastoquinone (complex I) [Gordonia sp. TBRC 11910]|uniref:NADH/ubiquinone/plastoquinone (Complex I) n=1 Tax=Gordonia asplenii TaxID=2725283 RepID=A0A848L0K2_9ACTN|nr:proton-conducting transporter membrane subunit [Gordonia asplenii]NMO04490.1 NADH/ubiquinone/plastoquinone (complex I) [Gordonia asplenii]
MTILSALVVFALAGSGSLVCGSTGELSAVRTRLVQACWLANVGGAALGVIAGIRAIRGSPVTVDLGGTLGLGSSVLACDRLSGLFMVISFGVAAPALVAAARSGHGSRSRLPAAASAVLASMVLILTATSAYPFLFGWEALTVSFYLAVGFDRARRGRARSSVVTVVFGRCSGALLLVGMLLIASTPGSGLDFDEWHLAESTARASIAYALLLAGFAVKVGLLPAHLWLPDAYSSAPAPVRGLLAGAAVNVGFYGMWRTFELLGAPASWLACAVLIVGGLSALYGIAQAAVNPLLPTLIAWSSVENSGVITAGFGAALAGAVAHNDGLVVTGLVAATAQLVTHAIAKTLLFTATASAEEATGETRLDALGGIAHRLPWTAAGLTVGSLTLAGLPLTAGFTSEWLTLEALMQQFRLSRLSLQLCTTAAAVLVALTIGVAALTFVRVVALTAFGPDRLDIAHRIRLDDYERSASFRTAVATLIVAALALSAFAPAMVSVITRAVASRATGSPTMRQSPWVIQPAFDGFSALSPTWLWIVLPMMTLAVGVVGYCASRGGLLRVRRVDPWSSGSPGVDRGLGYTSFGFANPMRHVMGNVLRTRRSSATADPAGRDLSYTVDVSDIIAEWGYRPLGRLIMVGVRQAKRLQSGRLDAYMTYMLIAVVAVLAVVVATR